MANKLGVRSKACVCVCVCVYQNLPPFPEAGSYRGVQRSSHITGNDYIKECDVNRAWNEIGILAPPLTISNLQVT